MIVVIFIPFLFSFNVKISDYLFRGKFSRQVFRILFISVIFVFSALFIGEYSSEQRKMQKFNKMTLTPIFTKEKYSVGETDFSNVGILKSAPFAIFAGIIRPLPWEALTPGLIINGIESLFIIFLIFRFFRKSKLKISAIRNNNLTIYFLYFIIILALFTGLTSILFGVLVRVRAPLIPFLILILIIENLEDKNENSADKNNSGTYFT